MSAENLERARSMWLGEVNLTELLEGGPDRVREIFPLLRSDVKVEFIAQNPEASLSYEGVEGLYEGWRDWLGPWSSYVISMRDLVNAGSNEIVLMGHAEARTSRDAVLMEHRPGTILTFDEDGLVSRLRFYLDSADALRAAGVDAP